MAASPDSMRFHYVVSSATATTAATHRSPTQEWDALADRLVAPPFLRPGWIEAWCRAYAKTAPVVLEARRGGELAGVLPVIRHRRTTTGPTNSHTPVFGPLAADEDAAAELAERAVAELGGALVLEPVDPAHAATAAFGDGLRRNGRLTLVEALRHAPYVPVEGSFDDYLKGLSKNHRKQLARRRRRLEEAGQVTVEVQTSTRGLGSALEDFVQLESSGWKKGSGTAIASRRANRDFYAEVARWAAERGSLRLSFLALDGRPIAAELGLEEGGVLYALKGGFDPAYGSFGPGQLLTHESLARSFAAGLDSYEFLGRDEGYKLAWTSATRERVRLRAFRPTLGGRMSREAHRRGRPLWQRLRSS
jgi:CelD/BcsL family acetyltransferase involved in cellulose biosynthesis